MVPFHSPFKNTNKPVTTSHACWLLLGWKWKIYPSLMNILFTAWNSLPAGFVGSGIFIIIWHNVAWVCLSIKSSVAISYVKQVSICAWNCAWCVHRVATFALACVLVNSQWSQTGHILNPSGKTVALEEYRYSIQLVTIWWILSILIWSTFTGVLFVLVSFFAPSSIAW